MEEEDVGDKHLKLSLETSAELPPTIIYSEIKEAIKRDANLADFQMITLPDRSLEEDLQTSSPLKFEVRCLI